MANLRIIYKNVFDSYATASASNTNTNYPLINTLKDTKGLVWRSTTTSSTIDMTWSSAQTLSAVVLPFSNLSATATIRVRMYSDTGMASMVYDSGTVTAVPAVLSSIYPNTVGSNYRYSYGGNYSARKYTTKVTTCRGLKIDIVDTSNTDGYLEISRIIVGDYWSPVYNTQFGLSVGTKDLSTTYRTQTGNLTTDNGSTYKTLSFDLSYLTASDRDTLFSIINTGGIKKSIYVSLFPEDADPNKEQIHQIYGRFLEAATITHPMYTVYASSLTVEEV